MLQSLSISVFVGLCVNYSDGSLVVNWHVCIEMCRSHVIAVYIWQKNSSGSFPRPIIFDLRVTSTLAMSGIGLHLRQ